MVNIQLAKAKPASWSEICLSLLFGNLIFEKICSLPYIWGIFVVLKKSLLFGFSGFLEMYLTVTDLR